MYVCCAAARSLVPQAKTTRRSGNTPAVLNPALASIIMNSATQGEPETLVSLYRVQDCDFGQLSLAPGARGCSSSLAKAIDIETCASADKQGGSALIESDPDPSCVQLGPGGQCDSVFARALAVV